MNPYKSDNRCVLAAALPFVFFAALLAVATACVAPGFALQAGEGQEEEPAFLQRPSHEEMKAKAEALEAQVAADSTDYELTFELAGVYYDMGSLLMAAKYYEKAAQLDPITPLPMMPTDLTLSVQAGSSMASTLARTGWSAWFRSRLSDDSWRHLKQRLSLSVRRIRCFQTVNIC